MFIFKKKNLDIKNKTNELEDSFKKDRLFFHDIINHTHGLLLFLGVKETCGKSLELADIELLQKEIKTLQCLIVDHYHMKHKNLPNNRDWVDFEFIQNGINHLLQTYLAKAEVKLTYSGPSNLKGEFHYPSFFRMMNNIIKNISESQALAVEVSVRQSLEGLYIETKNAMGEWSEGEGRRGEKAFYISERLSRVILEEKNSHHHSLGLESIYHLAEECGGNFNFEIKDHHWFNNLFIPNRDYKNNINIDKKTA